MEMHAKILSVMFCALAMSTQSLAQDELSHISPENEKVSVGLAGAEPPDIARFLLARGAISNAQMSPDGAQIAFLQDHTGTRQLWVLDVSGDAPRQITFGNGVTFFEWAPNSLEILYGADNNGDEQESYYLISADGLSEQLVLPADFDNLVHFQMMARSSHTHQPNATALTMIFTSPVSPAGKPVLFTRGRFSSALMPGRPMTAS
jgi:dipeptidyl aminopeptidase/acylaminoacyl peptidase